MNKNFSMVHDLSQLSETEKQEYLKEASAYFGLDPNLNALDLIWMDGGDGKRRLIAYARRGTTDILRGIHGINVLSITKDSGQGYVSFTAVGKNSEGRQEIAVGAAALDGLKGDRLAAAVATAQTRALRRLTLQFVGGGLLDESELNETTTDINRSNASLASMATLPAPQPAVEPNPEAGKDVTTGGLPGRGGFMGTKDMIAPAPFSSGTIQPQPIPGTEPIEKLVEIEPAPESKTRRRRRTKAEMEAARNNVNASEDFGEGPYLGPEHIKVKEEELKIAMKPLYDPEPPFIIAPEIIQAGNELIQNLADTMKPLFAAAQQGEYPTKEQEDGYRARLKVYTNEILKDGGMTDGIIWRVRKYTMHLFPEAIVENGKLKLTIKQWDTLLAKFDDVVEVMGRRGLVLIINEVAEKA